MADAEAQLIAFPAVSQAAVDRDRELWVDTLGDACGALADRLERGEITETIGELRMMARDYADVHVPQLPQDR